MQVSAFLRPGVSGDGGDNANWTVGEFSKSTVPTSSSLLDELPTLFAGAPTPEMILEFRPSPKSIDRANRLLEMSRNNSFGEDARPELEQFEQAERLMRLVKARLRANQTRALPSR